MSKATTNTEMVTVKPNQDIVISMVKEFKEELKKILDQEDALLTLDLEGVKMIDSMGLGVLIATHNSLSKRNAKLELIHVADDILKLLNNMRLDKHFSIK